ncbi:glycosyltransferase involved in cell wall biosynthesis [Haloplanus aerogenes]|nr:glycosyltransferase involved in cell wall biosynthesis [Haloplanus aerogenes]
MRVLLGPEGVAGQLVAYADGLTKHGISVSTLSKTEHEFEYEYDIVIWPNGECSNLWKSRMDRLMTTLKILPKFDVFHYFSSKSIFANYLDLRLAGKLNKLRVMSFTGSSSRIIADCADKNPYLDSKRYPSSITDARRKSRLKQLSDVIDVALIQYYELEDYIAPYFDTVERVPRAVDTQSIQPCYPESKGPIRIAHAPTNRYLKGTNELIEIVSSFRTGEVILDIIEGVSHTEALDRLSKADIIVDALRQGWYGVVALEGWALGKPVMAYVRGDLMSRYPDNIPIVNTNLDSLKEDLLTLIGDPDLRNEIGRQSRDYVEQHHDQAQVAKQLINIYRDQL